MAENQNERGLLIVYTGSGKGKTTAALGMALRAVGYNQYVSMIQFIKGDWFTGEMESIKRLAPNFELLRGGEGFVKIMGDTKPLETHEMAAQQTLQLAREAIQSDKFDLIIMDEINYALHSNLIHLEDVKGLISLKSERLNLVLTGNHAHKDIIDMADLVTEMRVVKHPYKQGIPAKQGIDF